MKIHYITNRSLGKPNPPSHGQTSEKAATCDILFNMWRYGDHPLKMFVKVMIY